MMIMLVSCHKYLHKVIRSRRIWLDSCGIPFVILVGNPLLEEEYVYNSGNKILTLRCKDDYEHLPSKVFLGVKALHALFRPSGILKIDDDVLVRVKKLQTFAELPNKPSYVGTVSSMTGYMSAYHKGKCMNETVDKQRFYVPQNVKYCLGAMYYIDSVAIQCLINNMNPTAHIYEDVLVGTVLNSCNIYPVQSPWLTDHLVTFLMIKDYIAYHDVKSKNNFTYIVSMFNLNSSLAEIMLLILLFYICIMLILTLLFWNSSRMILFK